MSERFEYHFIKSAGMGAIVDTQNVERGTIDGDSRTCALLNDLQAENAALKAENQRLRKAGIAALDGLLYAVRDLDRIDISLGAEALACCNGYEGGINAFHVFEYVKPELRGNN